MLERTEGGSLKREVNITEYLNEQGIRWFPLNIEIKWDSKEKRYKKKPTYVGGRQGYTPKTNDFERLSDGELKERQTKAKECSHVAIDTQRVKHMDFDTDDHPELMQAMMKKMPYFLSSTKKLPHCLLISDDLSAKKVLTKYEKVEVLAGIWSFCDHDAIVYNADAEIPEIKLEAILHAVHKTEKQERQGAQIDYETLEKVVKGLNESRYSEYNDWLLVIFAIIRTGEDNGYMDKATQLVHTWSKQHPTKYDKTYLDKLIKEYFKAERSPGYGTLCYYLKQDDEKLFKKLCKQNKIAELGPSYEDTKKGFEEHTFKILNPPAYVSRIEGQTEYKVLSEYQLITKYRHLVYNTEDRFIKRWIDDPKLKLFATTDFIPPPTTCNGDVFNMWTPFEVEGMSSETTGDIEPILKHIKHICNHEETHVEYFTKWLAHLMQKPGELNGIAVVFKGKQGSGKNTLTYLLRDMMGSKYYSEVKTPGQIFGRFANARYNRLLINMDEVNVPFANKDELKNMITSRVYVHETKGTMPIELRSFNRFIFTTNNDIPLPIEIGDRRLVVFATDDSIVNNKEYFTKLQECCKEPANQKAFYEHLQSIDISEVDWVNDRPLTEEYKDIQGVMVPKVARFLQYFATTMDTTEGLTMEALYQHYKTYMSLNGWEKEIGKSNGVGMQLKKYKGVTKERTMNCMVYYIDKDIVLEYLHNEYNI